MDNIEYVKFNEINPHDLLPLLNSPKIRTHLIEHALFTIETLTDWMNDKVQVNAIQGCKVRAIFCNTVLVGWCGIQFEDEKHEIAIIIDDKVWGLGKRVFKDMMAWAKEMGHEEVYIHFLHTRPDYKFLNKLAKSVSKTELFGNEFTCYKLAVNECLTSV
jgi:hypothetical protein